jgi:hypothetical protein
MYVLVLNKIREDTLKRSKLKRAGKFAQSTKL